MMSSRAQSCVWTMAVAGQVLMLAGCAKHADFIELRDQVSTVARSQEQDHQRVDAALRRMESLERMKDGESGKARLDEFAARLQKIETRLAKFEEGQGLSSSKLEPAPPEVQKPAKPAKPQSQAESPTIVPNVPGITPTSAFNLAYNDYLNGKYELAVAGFQRFIKDFPGTSLTPNAHYWLGESYYNQKDYTRAIQAFEYLVTEYPGNEKVPAALYKLGLATAETGDLVKSRKYLKHVLEDFPASDEAKLAKNKLAELR
ncbi:tol-pal system protein YbgF [Nitrospira sp. NS4]|uniref:tol-pal system protein YbgF n=1 Tax=Nitrospira sp. NS4 TaxID=3414498 RepID=UPI003C2CDCDB